MKLWVLFSGGLYLETVKSKPKLQASVQTDTHSVNLFNWGPLAEL